MRLIILIIFCLLSYNGSTLNSDQDFSKKNNPSKEISDTISNNEFYNRDFSYAKVSGSGDNIITEYSNVVYTERHLNYWGNFDHFIVKRQSFTKLKRGQEGQESRIKVEIFNIPESKVISTIETDADDISIVTNYYILAKYTCCGGEDSYEIKTLWENKTFLTYNTKFYYIEIPNARNNFYFGYSSDAWNEKELILGELNFALSSSEFNSVSNRYYDSFKPANKIIFKAKTKEIFDKIAPFCPDMTLLKHSDKDQLIDYSDHQELRLWSYDSKKDLSGINLTGLKLVFQNDKAITVEIPIINGYLFGKANEFNKIVYIDE